MKEEKKTLALVGNPNCGKTTLFNLLTKSKEATGNRAGVTFEVKKAEMRKKSGLDAVISDLPGIYSLSPYGNDEKTAESYLKESTPDAIINIADATNLSRGLFLTTELLEKGIPTLLALNMEDEAKKEGINIDKDKLSEMLGIPVVMISAAKKHGITELISSVSELLEKTQNAFNSPAFDFPSDRKRSEFSEKLADEVTTYLQKNPHAEDRIDALICKKAVGIPLFFIIMMCVFALTFSFLGDIACLAVEKLFSGLSSTLEKILILLGTSDHISKFVVSVFESGIGAVVSFIPRIAILFALLELLEDSGYLSRAAFVMDAPMRRLGLSGKSFIPFVMGFGCTVPAVLWAKVLEKKEQKNVIFSLPFIPCGARFPVFAMITGSFFPSHRALASFIIYACGISAAFLSLLLLAKNKKAPPLSMELPKYRIPRPSNIVRVMNEKIREFISRAGSIVFLSASVIYILSAVNPSMRLAESADESILAYIAKALSPLLLPIGLSDYRVCAALISGFFAKESIVSTLSVLGVTDISSVLSLPQGISLCAFSLLYSPCAATVAACRLRLGKKDAAAVFFRSLIFAYAVSFIIYTAAVFCGL